MSALPKRPRAYSVLKFSTIPAARAGERVTPFTGRCMHTLTFLLALTAGADPGDPPTTAATLSVMQTERANVAVSLVVTCPDRALTSLPDDLRNAFSAVFGVKP